MTGVPDRRPPGRPPAGGLTADVPGVVQPADRLTAPAWAVRLLVTGGALLVLAVAGWLTLSLVLRLPLVTVPVAVALLLATLVEPLARWLRRRGLRPALSALLSMAVVLGVVTGAGVLVGLRAAGQLEDLTGPLTAGIDRVRDWLTEGPLGLDPQRVADIRDTVVARIADLTPAPSEAARTAVQLLAALVLVLFLSFFLVKDGGQMWAWVLARVPGRRRDQVDGAGRCAWTVLSRYVRGLLLVAGIDAVGIGGVLLVLGVPLWVALTLLTFLGAFVPVLGATITGAVAVLVTLVTNGPTDAAVVLAVVLVVQQVEGNLLQPLLVGHAVRLHPVVIVVAVSAGTLLWGLAGALLAVPLTAVTYRVAEHLRTHPAQ